MTAIEERNRRAEQQRGRRMARRRCGNCSSQAEEMLDWLGQVIPICSSCRGKLATAPSPPVCAFDEVSPLLVRPPEQVFPPAVSEVAAEQEGREEEGTVVLRTLNRILRR